MNTSTSQSHTQNNKTSAANRMMPTGEITAEIVHAQMTQAIADIAALAKTMPWEDTAFYANWLVQSYSYVRWTTRQLALASAYTKPGSEDHLHWRFLEEAREEKKHEALAEHDVRALGFSIESFPELAHTAFFYQTLSYMIEREDAIAILGYSLTLEGYAATSVTEMYNRIKTAHGENASTFMRLHCEVDVEHFNNALPYLQNCSAQLLPIVSRGVAMCRAIYMGILRDTLEYHHANCKGASLKNETTVQAFN